MPKALCERQTWQLADWLAFQEQSHPKAWDLGLERIGAVWQNLGAPPLARHIITIAGTNGKGSCVRWLEALCGAAGISVMSFSSPHLLAYNERIRHNSTPIADQDLVRAFEAIDAARGNITLTYFEWSALAMFYQSALVKPQVAVLEVGLGGRLDATNLIDAHSTIFTCIGLDHQDWLGHDVETIAREKAGVLRAGQNVFFADSQPPQSLLDAAHNIKPKALLKANDFVDETNDGLTLTLNQTFALPKPKHMHGTHQYGHFAACVLALQHAGFELSQSALRHALEQTQHFGRLMMVADNVMVDVAHNQDSAEILATHLCTLRQQKRFAGRVLCVCGMLNDKDQTAIFQQLKPEVARFYLATLDGTRGTPAQQLAQSALQAGIDAHDLHQYDDVQSALHAAQTEATADDWVLVMGSFVTVAQVLPWFSSTPEW